MNAEQESQLTDLNQRRALCMAFIDVLDQIDPAEPRRAGALEEYKRQLAEIDSRIAALTGKPPDIVVGLKTAQLFGKAG
jgi:hypothetical protein